MIDLETLTILTLGVHNSPDSVPYNSVQEALSAVDSPDELRCALSEAILIIAGMARGAASLTDLSAFEIVERYFALLKALSS